jgi:hypothetical protein
MPLIRNTEEFRNELFQNIHTFLQTKMMLNACVSAKRSCFWAAIEMSIIKRQGASITAADAAFKTGNR